MPQYKPLALFVLNQSLISSYNLRDYSRYDSKLLKRHRLFQIKWYLHNEIIVIILKSHFVFKIQSFIKVKLNDKLDQELNKAHIVIKRFTRAYILPRIMVFVTRSDISNKDRYIKTMLYISLVILKRGRIICHAISNLD